MDVTKKTFLVSLVFLSLHAASSFADEKAPIPEVQLVRVGAALGALDSFSTPVAAAPESEQTQALALEKEIMIRKFGQREKLEAGVPVELAMPVQKMRPPASVKTVPSLSVLSHESLFEDADRELVDSFRTGDNFDNFMTRLVSFLDYNIGIYGEWDDNIFLTPDDQKSDWKTIVNQSIEVKYPMDTFYLELLYAVNFDIYTKVDEVVDTQNALFRLSYYPFDKLSVAISDAVTKVGDSEIGTNFGDQVLTLGYITNNLTMDMQYELWRNGFFQMSWIFDHIEFENDNIKRFINRDVHVIDTRLKHRFTPRFSNYMGHRFKDAQFYDFRNKDQESNILFYGAEYEMPGWFTATGEIGYEQKSFEHTLDFAIIRPINVVLPVTDRRNQDGNVNYRLAIDSNFSRFNKIGLSFESQILESSRPEFTQYLSKTFALNSRWFLDNKTILFKSFYLEYQEFDDDDMISVFFPDGNADTKIYASGLTLRRILTDWLYFDLGYTHIFRNTDFPNEDSRNSRIRFGARATF